LRAMHKKDTLSILENTDSASMKKVKDNQAVTVTCLTPSLETTDNQLFGINAEFIARIRKVEIDVNSNNLNLTEQQIAVLNQPSISS